MEVALLRDASPEPLPAGLPGTGRPLPEPRVLARGILDALRLLSGDAPLVLAVDDAQWLDRPSAGVLEFCFRRLQGEPVSILLTFRNGRCGSSRSAWTARCRPIVFAACSWVR